MVTDGAPSGVALEHGIVEHGIVEHGIVKHGIVKHSLLVAGHRTSISLEDAFWSALRRLAADRGQSVAALVATIDAGRGDANLSSAIRVYVLETYMALPRAGLP